MAIPSGSISSHIQNVPNAGVEVVKSNWRTMVPPGTELHDFSPGFVALYERIIGPNLPRLDCPSVF